MKSFNILTQYLSRKMSGFTLIEMLLTMGIIVVLISGLMVGVSKAQKGAEITKNKNLLVQAGHAIQSFQQDFGELPASLSLIVSEKSLKDYANSRNIGFSREGAYLDAVPTAYCGLYLFRACESFNPFDASTSSHYNRNVTLIGDIASENFWKNCTQLGGTHSSAGGLVSLKTYLTPMSLTNNNAANSLQLTDYWGNMVMYQRDLVQGSFKLISGGPDGLIDISNGTVEDMVQGTYNYLGNGVVDKDNIVMEFN